MKINSIKNHKKTKFFHRPACVEAAVEKYLLKHLLEASMDASLLGRISLQRPIRLRREWKKRASENKKPTP
ncbi:hypothetical protein DDR56_18450 [Halomonas venusta]|uniref:Uncharacterized protein n=1 Tax=Vreelandella venusta TaxID=44935 RepID=A0ABX2BIU5_9GAMM|nr:hypothetical protein [Halomonas venusta]